MKITGNTIFITGGGSGIGRGLAEALHKTGNQVIISGRRKGHLEEVVKANPGMKFVELNVEDPKSIESVAKKLIAEHPRLNVIVNNAGIMSADMVENPVEDKAIESIVVTNFLGPIRVTSAFIEHLKKQPSATVITVSSGLAFVPLAFTATYSATKAAIHSYSMSLRHRLKNTSVKVVEIAPPWVKTELMGANDDPRQMPLDEFINETIKLLATDTDEVVVERAQFFRKNPGPNEHQLVNGFNDQMAQAATAH
jgi:uncharacterized oxidoreductase